MISPHNPPPLPVPAALTLGAIALAPLIGAAISLAQLSWVPFGYGAGLSVGLYVAYCVGVVVADARKARSKPLSPRNANCWSCGMEQGDSGMYRRELSQGTRADPPPSTTETISPPLIDGSVARPWQGTSFRFPPKDAR